MIILFSLQFFFCFPVYPKVKVRSQDDQHARHEHNWSSLLSLKDIQFLLLQDSCFPVKEYRDVSSPPIARIPKSYVPNIVLAAESAPEGTDKKSNSDEEDRPKIKASSVPQIRASTVPRPRAVISSPDNDAVVGNKNKVKPLRASTLKNQTLIQSRHAQCKVVRNQAVEESPESTRKSKDNTDSKFDLKGKKGSATAISSQRRNITTNKPISVRI